MRRLLRWLTRRLKSSRIGNGSGDIFFLRYDVLKTRFGSVYLHEFLRGDIDRCLHDHPWAFVSIVLCGGYWEEMRIGPEMVYDTEESAPGPTHKYWRRPGSILYRAAKTSHRIELEPDSRSWSLVFVGPKVRPWGFWTIDGWRPWRAGEASPICETDRP